MANEQNLIPLNKRSKSVQREIQQKGRAANKAKCERDKLIKELLLAALKMPCDKYLDADTVVLDENGQPTSAAFAGVFATVKNWLNTGDWNGMEKIMVAAGQKPVDKVESKEDVQVTYRVVRS